MRTDRQRFQSGIPTSALSEADHDKPASYFRETYRVFIQAQEAAGGPVERLYTVGGCRIRLRFAGPALLPLITPALEHLASEPQEEAALTVCLWDSTSTRTIMPLPPWSPDDYLPRGEIRGYNNESINTMFQPGPGILCLFDASQDLALFWIQDAASIPYYETGAPLRSILHWFMRHHRRQFAHAAAVGTPRGGVLIAGKGGTGKSTTTLACLSSELLYVGDDYVLLGSEPTPYVYSLYNSAKLDADSMHRFPHLVPIVHNSDKLDQEKAVIFLNEHYPDKLMLGCPVRAVLIPRITGLPETRLKTASPAEGLRALAISTIFQLPGAKDGDLRSLMDFVKQVPSYVLELGTNLPGISEAILSLLSEDRP